MCSCHGSVLVLVRALSSPWLGARSRHVLVSWCGARARTCSLVEHGQGPLGFLAVLLGEVFVPLKLPRHGWGGMAQWLWAERATSNRRKPNGADRDVPFFVVAFSYLAKKNVTDLLPCLFPRGGDGSEGVQGLAFGLSLSAANETPPVCTKEREKSPQNEAGFNRK